MKQTLLLAAVSVLLFFSCAEEIPQRHTYSDKPGQEADHSQTPDSELVPVFYIAGVEYPEGYDWLRDPDYGTVECEMFLQRGRKRLLQLSVGYEQCIASDMDMCRCVGRHLYTDFSTDSQTVVCRDGEELFRFPGREMILGFIADSSGVYTLGAPRDGDGWTLRRNGAPMASSEYGLVFTDLYVDDGAVVFGYKVEANDVYERKEAYFLVRDGVEEEIAAEGDILDFRLCGGVLRVLCGSADGVLLTEADMMYPLEMPQGAESVTARKLVADGDRVYVLGEAEFPSGEVCDVLWQDCDVSVVFEADFDVSACYPDGERIVAIGRDRENVGQPVYYVDGKYSRVDEGYAFMSEASALVTSGHYCLLLFPLSSDARPMYIVDGEVVTLDFCGFLSAVGFEWGSVGEDEEADEDEGDDGMDDETDWVGYGDGISDGSEDEFLEDDGISDGS